MCGNGEKYKNIGPYNLICYLEDEIRLFLLLLQPQCDRRGFVYFNFPKCREKLFRMGKEKKHTHSFINNFQHLFIDVYILHSKLPVHRKAEKMSSSYKIHIHFKINLSPLVTYKPTQIPSSYIGKQIFLIERNRIKTRNFRKFESF